MHPTLAARCDRRGHGAIRAALVLAAGLLVAAPAAAAGPGNYKAQRFDVAVRVVQGSLDVNETIVFEFQSGTFQKVWREIPESRTDGIEILAASMDGHPATPGEGPGHIAVSRRSRVRVEWQFAPTGPSTHTFALRYIARGAAYREGGQDVVRWKLLPNEHSYKIDQSRSTIVAPVHPSAAPVVESRRAATVSSDESGNDVAVAATGIGQNGWVIAEIHYPPESLGAAPPDWQQRAAAAAALAPRWEMSAAALFILALLVLLVARQGYDSPGFDGGVEHATTTEPPDALPAALAAALAAKGRASGYQSVATLLDLAERGVLTVRELPRRLGARNYGLAQVPGKHDLDDHEAEALSIAFAGSGDDVTMSKARARLARGARRFSAAVNGDLVHRGFLDPARKVVRDRLTAIAVFMLFAAGIGCIGVAALIPRYQGWPFLLPLALALCGIIGIVMTAATTSLSDEGLVQGARWRGFKRHLKTLAGAREDRGAATVRSRWIVYAIALGLSYQWSRYLKKHPGVAPSWFAGATSDDGAFAAFVGSNAASTGATGSGGAAAGGGGSGAG